MPAALVAATPEADVVGVPARAAIALDGAGAPDCARFQLAVAAIHGVAYALRLARRRAGAGEFKIGPLEARWWADVDDDELPAGVAPPRDRWRWRLRIAVPRDVTAAQVAAAAAAKQQKAVFLERIPAQRVGRALHVGPYADEGRTFARIAAALAADGATPAPSHLEIYLGDPRRTPPARLKTVLLRETMPA